MTDTTDGPAAKWRAFTAIALAFVSIVMATTMVFVLLSAIADDFGVTLGAVGWVVIIESLIISALLLPLGAVADRIGRRRVYVTGLVVLGVGSVLTGLAPTFAMLIGARVVMSIGNALVQSVVTGMLVAAFPPEERGRALGAQTTAVSVGAAAGPLVGGLALQVMPWEALFFLLCIPVGASIVAAFAVLEPDRPAPAATAGSPPFDAIGAVLSAAAVVVLVSVVGNPFGLRWLSAPTLAGAGLVVVLVGAFVRWELRQPAPMLELRLFARSLFRIAVSIRFLGFIGATTAILLLPIYLVSFRGLAEGLAGAVIFLVAAGMGVAAQISGNLSDRVGPRPPIVVGLALQAATGAVFALVGSTVSIAALAPVVFLAGLSAGLWNVPANSAMMGSVTRDSFAVMGAFTNVTRTMGSVVGQALTTGIVVAVMAGRGFDIPLSEIAGDTAAGDAFLAGWRAAFWMVVGVSLVALALGLRLPPSAIVPPDLAAAGRRTGSPPVERP